MSGLDLPGWRLWQMTRFCEYGKLNNKPSDLIRGGEILDLPEWLSACQEGFLAAKHRQ
jgi:hypothetical protein